MGQFPGLSRCRFFHLNRSVEPIDRGPKEFIFVRKQRVTKIKSAQKGMGVLESIDWNVISFRRKYEKQQMTFLECFRLESKVQTQNIVKTGETTVWVWSVCRTEYWSGWCQKKPEAWKPASPFEAAVEDANDLEERPKWFGVVGWQQFSHLKDCFLAALLTAGARKGRKCYFRAACTWRGKWNAKKCSTQLITNPKVWKTIFSIPWAESVEYAVTWKVQSQFNKTNGLDAPILLLMVVTHQN